MAECSRSLTHALAVKENGIKLDNIGAQIYAKIDAEQVSCIYQQ